MSEIARTEKEVDNLPQIMPGFGNLQGFELSLRVANLLSKSMLVPKEYQDNIPNCVIALNMSTRMNADPLMVMQNLHIVYGRPGWSAQFLISTFNSSGRFTALRYKWSGEPSSDNWGCQAWAQEKATGEKLEGSVVTIAIAKKEGWYSKNGSKWQTMPQQMLMYRAASWFIRAYAPELAMGMHTEDEVIDMIDITEDNYEAKVDAEIAANANIETIDVAGNEPLLEKHSKNEKNQETTPKTPPSTGPGF